MSEEKRPNRAAETLKEIQRLQTAYQEAPASYLAIQKRIADMQARLTARKDGTVIVEPERDERQSKDFPSLSSGRRLPATPHATPLFTRKPHFKPHHLSPSRQAAGDLAITPQVVAAVRR